MKIRVLIASTLVFAGIVSNCNTLAAKESYVAWTHLSSDNGQVPKPDVGRQAASLILDIDKDGVDDFVIAGWGNISMVWLRRVKDGWDRYLIDDRHSHIEAGGTYWDIDGDGDLDILQGGSWMTNEVWWWENPCPEYGRHKSWNRYTIKAEGAKQHHDQIFGDFDGDGKAELVFWNQTARKLVLADVPAEPKNSDNWELAAIWTWPKEFKYEGLAKADIDGDGKEDLIGGGMWFKHKGEKKYTAEMIDDYGMSRSAAGDIITGGRVEVVLGSGDGVGPLNLYEWNDGRWKKRTLIETVDHGHSLQVADVDGDGNLDIFAAEMVHWHNGENPDSKTWILYGNGKGEFRTVELKALEGIGSHESRLGDLDGDGDLDILQKPFELNVPRVDVWLNNGTCRELGEQLSGSSSPGPSEEKVKVSDTEHEGQESWKIETPTATYYYHKKGAGFASIEDRQGNDWIGYRLGGESAGEYRGIPNLVHPEGYFHPGGENCRSELVADGPLKATIYSESSDKKWACKWDIFPTYARLTVLKAAHEYWFLYEGTPGGKIDMDSDYCVRAGGARTSAAEKWAGDIKGVDGVEWLYFGDGKRILFLVHHEDDELVDSYWPMRGEMTVFGFGRQNLNKYVTKTPAQFTIGLADVESYEQAKRLINSVCQQRSRIAKADSTILNF